MKPYLFFFYASCLTLLLLFGGCSDDSELPSGTDSEWKPIEVASCRAQLGVNKVTRTSPSLTEIKTGALGLYRKKSENYEALENIRYEYKEATDVMAARWESTAQAIYVNAKMADIYAIYPYMEINGEPTNEHSFNGTSITGMHQQRYYSDSRNEIMISRTCPANNRAPRLELIMQHIYSRLTVRIKNETTDTLRIKALTIQPKATYTTEASVNVSETTPTPVQTQTSSDGYPFPFNEMDTVYTKGIASNAVDESIEMIWIPQSFTANTEITIVVSGNSLPLPEITLTATIPQAHLPKLEQGTQHIISLLVKGTTVSGSVTKPTLTVVDEYDPFEENKLPSYTLPPVNVGGIYVATGNVFNYYHTNLLQTWYTFSGKSGGVFGSTPVATFTQTEVNSADPCQKVGPNWHTPSAEQLKTIMNAKVGSRTSLTDRGTTSYGWYVGAENSGAFFAENYKYLSRDGGYLNVTSDGMTYVESAGTTAYTVRCVSDTQYGTPN